MSNKTSFDKVHNASDIDVYKQIQTDNDSDYVGNAYKYIQTEQIQTKQIQKRCLQIDSNTGDV